MNNKRGQIWVETIIYTLIAFVMIGLVLFFASPRIGKAQDKAVIDQSLTVMGDIDSLISDISIPGNKRVINLEIRKGTLKIDGGGDRLIFEIESRHTYSEPGKNVSHGDIVIFTDKKGDYNLVTLTRDYANSYNITYAGKDELKLLSQSSTPYKLVIANKGNDPLDVLNINFEIN